MKTLAIVATAILAVAPACVSENVDAKPTEDVEAAEGVVAGAAILTPATTVDETAANIEEGIDALSTKEQLEMAAFLIALTELANTTENTTEREEKLAVLIELAKTMNKDLSDEDLTKLEDLSEDLSNQDFTQLGGMLASFKEEFFQGEVLGIKAGEKVPEEYRQQDDAHETLRVAYYPAKAGFDEIGVFYTDKAGACWVAGGQEVFNPRTDISGVRHKKAVDRIAERVEAKLGRPATEHRDFNNDTFWGKNYWLNALDSGGAGYEFHWEGEDAKPFLSVVAKVMVVGIVVVRFDFMTSVLCELERIDDF